MNKLQIMVDIEVPVTSIKDLSRAVDSHLRRAAEDIIHGAETWSLLVTIDDQM